MRFVQYDRDDGLSQSAINQIVQDASGFMWFATESGLNRFDGYEFTVSRRMRDDPRTLPNDFVTDMAVDAAGDLWLTTDGGGLVHRRGNPIDMTVYQVDPAKPNSSSANNLRRTLADPRGWIWVGTMRDGLRRVNPLNGEIAVYKHDSNHTASLSDNRVYALWLDDDGSLWIGTGEGVDRLDPETGHIQRFGLGLAAEKSVDNRVLAIRRDRRGNLLIGSAQHGLAILNDKTGEFEVFFLNDETNPRSLSSNRVEVIFEDSAERLWIGTNDGLNLLNADRDAFTTYRNDPTDPSSLSDNYVTSIFEDRSGVLWVGTKTGGINKWNARSWLFGHFRPETNNENSQAPKITSFTRDPNGQLWVGTFGNGIMILDSKLELKTQLRAGADSKLSDDTVMALLTDDNGMIWAGTMHGGLNRINPLTGDISLYRHDAKNAGSIPADGIMSLYKAVDGTVWIGTFGGGVSHYSEATDSFINYPHDPDIPNSLSNPNATAIIEDVTGALWVATSGGGLNRLNANRDGWEHFAFNANESDSLSSNAVYSLHVDNAGNLWAGTRAGLNRYLPRTGAQDARGSFATITQADGLSNDVVYGVLSDSEGRLWLSTNYGISRYDPGSGEIRSFHVSDGLQGEEFNFGAYLVDEFGTLYFGGNNGFNAFDPIGREVTAKAPKVVLTGISKFNEPADTGIAYEFLSGLSLDYVEDMVSFEFAALEYTAPSRNRYAYKLAGFDRDWVQAGTTRTATYTDLPGGTYEFMVRGANSDGVWSDAELNIAINVKQPPWLRPWAYALYLLIAVIAVYSLYRFHARKLEREAEYRKRLEVEVSDRTSDLAASNFELLDANDRLREASFTDALTGLHNRRYLFEEVLKEVTPEGERREQGRTDAEINPNLVFIMVDLDHFKPINDSCGHLAGDRVLLQVRDVLQSVCRTSDIVIRWGGDEFLIVCRDSTYSEASMLAERLRANIAEANFSVGNGQVERTTCSIGFASYPFMPDAPGLLNWEQVLGVADAAMYLAKEERNAWVGLRGSEWHDSADSLYQALQSDPLALADRGCVRIEKSFSMRDVRTA
ncbi:MAG: two-component regulator propeller domain-containing protein [Woeseia sp.]